MPFTGIGTWEMLLIAMIVLIVFGPRRLPEISRSMGKALREFKRGMNEIQRELEVAERETRWSETASHKPPGSTGSPGAPKGADPGTGPDSITSPNLSTSPPTGAKAQASTSPNIVPGSESPSGTEPTGRHEHPVAPPMTGMGTAAAPAVGKVALPEEEGLVEGATPAPPAPAPRPEQTTTRTPASPDTEPGAEAAGESEMEPDAEPRDDTQSDLFDV